MKRLRLLSLPVTILRNRLGARTQPRFLTHLVTFRCNARCVMCDSWRKPSPDELTGEEIDRLYRALPRMDFVRLTGGEPFIRPDLPEIARLAARHLDPFCLHVTSNGLLTDRIVRWCESRDRRIPLRLLISIDGMGDKHNAVRGCETAWERATATLKALAGRRRELNLLLAVNQTIVDTEGLEHYRRLRAFLRPLGIRNHAVMAYDVSATYSLKPDLDNAPREVGAFTTFGDFRVAELAELEAAIEADLPTLPWADRAAKRYYLRGIRERLLAGRGKPNPPCVALNSHLRLFPNGDVPVCQFNSRCVGNLRQQPFAAVWQGPEAAAQRRWVRACPGCWAECEILPNALYTGDILRAWSPRFAPVSPSTRQTPARENARSRAAGGEAIPAGSKKLVPEDGFEPPTKGL